MTRLERGLTPGAARQGGVQKTRAEPVRAGDGLPGPGLQEAAAGGAGHGGAGLSNPPYMGRLRPG